MMNLFENLCNMQESAESDDSKILTIKVSGLAPMSEFDNEEDAKDWANWIEDDYNLEVLEQGDNSPEDGYVIIKGDEYDLNNFIREVIDSDSDINSTFVKILENLKEAEESENDDYVEYVFKKLYSQDQNNMDEEELKYYYDGVANGENDDFIDNVINDLVNDYNYDYDFLDEYREEIIDKCIELAQENGFGE